MRDTPKPKIIPDRFVIRPEDIMAIEDCSLTSARRKLRTLRDSLDKRMITFQDYCEDTGLAMEDVLKRVGVEYSVI